MRHTKYLISAMACIALLFSACKPNATDHLKTSSPALTGVQVADTIIYSVVIKNPNPNDEWTDYSLSKLDRQLLVDQVFESVYAGKAQAYNYVSDEPMSVDEVKAIENDGRFSRDKVAKLQFWESWHFDKQRALMQKTVHATLMAYEVRSDQDELLGYKAAFYVKAK